MSSEVRWTSKTIVLPSDKCSNLSTADIKKIINSLPKNASSSTTEVIKIIGQVIEKADKNGTLQETPELKILEQTLEQCIDIRIECGKDCPENQKNTTSCSNDQKEEGNRKENIEKVLPGNFGSILKKVIGNKKVELVIKTQKKEKPSKSKENPKEQQKPKQPPKEEPILPPVPAPVVPPVKKVITETKIVESCEKCRDIHQETIKSTRLIESFERRIDEFEKVLQNKDADLALVKSQMTENKKKYREEIQNNREELANRDARIQQLQQELKEVYEDLRTEREEFYMEADKNSRIADETMRKVKIELENIKFAENNKEKQISDLMTENKQLKVRIEIFEENQDVDHIRELENRLAEMEKQIETSRIVESELKIEIERSKMLEKQLTEMEEQRFLSVENYEKELEDRNLYIQSIEIRLAEFESMSYSDVEQQNSSLEYSGHSKLFTASDYYENQKILEKFEEYENILNFDREQLIGAVEEVVNKFVSRCNNPKEVSLAKLELTSFSRKYDLYHRIVEEEYVYICQNPEIRFDALKVLPSFPQPFSAGFMEKYEMMLKCWNVEKISFLSSENNEKQLKEQSMSRSEFEQINEIGNSDHSNTFVAPENNENQKIQTKMEEYENILNIDREQLIGSVEKVVNRFVSKSKNPKEISLAKSEIANFSRKYDIYHRIVEEEYEYICQSPEICFDNLKYFPSVPQPFSAGFMEKYERMLKCWNVEENIEKRSFSSSENNEKQLEDKNVYIQSIEERSDESQLMPRLHFEQKKDNKSDNSKIFITSEKDENKKVQKKIEEYENILNFDREQLIGAVEDVVNRFVSKCKNPKEASLAKSEFANFSRKYDIYHRIVEEEHVYICQNPEIRFDKLEYFPSFPQPFSAGFMGKYEMMLKNWDVEENNEMKNGNGTKLEDKECLICATNMHYHQSITKCSVCCQKYHSKCVSKWLKMNSICPVCRSSLLDPSDFPRL